MSSVPGDERSGGSVFPALSLTDADRAFLLSMAAWGAPPQPENGPDCVTSDFRERVRHRLAPAGFARVCAALLDDSSEAFFSEPPKAREKLSRMHVGGARVEPAQIHPSWWVRALREESPAVRRLVAKSVPASLREPLQNGLLLDSQDLRSERPASAEVVSWVLALWTERLVGGEAERSDDPLAIIVLGRLSPRTGYRLCRLAGLCKLIVAGEEEANAGRPSNRARHDWLVGRLPVDTDLKAMARLDVEAGRSPKLPVRRSQAGIGLATLARLLADTEPFRLRWALQHWPYPIAKLVRSLMPPAGVRADSQVEWESLVLKTAWDRLNVEGRLAPSLADARADDGSHWDVSGGNSVSEPESHEALGSAPPAVTGDGDGPFDWLPRITHRQLGLERRLARWTGNRGLPASLDWLQQEIGCPISFDRPEVLARASGLRRAGLIAQLTAPRLATRLALGIETPLAHTIVDRLLGFDRPFAESRLQLTPVEWGVWTFLILRALDSLDSAELPRRRSGAEYAGLFGPADLTLDRVGPDPFDPQWPGVDRDGTLAYSRRRACVRRAVVGPKLGS